MKHHLALALFSYLDVCTSDLIVYGMALLVVITISLVLFRKPSLPLMLRGEG